MTVSWQKVKLPLLERLALAELAERRGQTEEVALAQLVRQAVKTELTTDQAPRAESRECDHETRA